MFLCAVGASFVPILRAVPASAGGIDLTYGACPDNVGVIPGGQGENGSFDGPTIDCASGQAIVILGTFATDEDVSTLMGLDCDLRAYVDFPVNDLDAAPFWNFAPDGCNANGLHTSQHKPATGCDAPLYTDTWNDPNSTALIATWRDGNSLRIALSCIRTTPIAVTAGERLFGMQIVIDGAAAEEAGGTCPGCCRTTFGLVWTQGTPQSSNSGQFPTPLNAPTGRGVSQSVSNTMGIKGGGPSCSPVPTRRQTWGQIQALYR